MHTPGDDREVRLIYGNKSVKDILLKAELDKMVQVWPAAHPEAKKGSLPAPSTARMWSAA